MPNNTQVMFDSVTVDGGTNVFYRFAGSPSSPPFLLLHGYPASSFQYRHLMPILAERFYVVAPDMPGFGFTKLPDDFVYTFDNLSKVIEAFIIKLNLSKPLHLYIFDYGAPVAMRIFCRNPSLFETIVSQNGNAYEVGLGPFWETTGIRKYWASGNLKDRQALQMAFQLESIRGEYTTGNPNGARLIDPQSYYMDHFLCQKNSMAMLDLFYDYRTNVALYPSFSQALRLQQPRLLAIWGKNDPAFLPQGAQAFANDIKADRIQIQLLDAGHFALESHAEEIGRAILDFVA